jgi:hypothetical protein
MNSKDTLFTFFKKNENKKKDNSNELSFFLILIEINYPLLSKQNNLFLMRLHLLTLI